MPWINPRYKQLTGQDPPAYGAGTEEPPREAPQDDGHRLATFPRPDREGGEAELRISLSEYQGSKFLSLRVWQLDRRSGQWWPQKSKGVSVRLREAEGVAAALLEGLRIIDGQHRPGAGAGFQRPASRPRRELPGQQHLPEVAPGGPDFDEFADN